MKTRLWATLTANGSYAQATPDHPPRPEALADFAAQAAEAGNFIVGRRTFEGFRAQASTSGKQPFSNTDIVVVTSRRDTVSGATSASSPRAALDLLASRGHSLALLAGGELLHNAFLEQDLVDEVVLIVAPMFTGKALQVALPPKRSLDLELLTSGSLPGNLVRLHYAVRH